MSHLASERDQADCRLLSAGSTTGWTDWIHGELCLCPEWLPIDDVTPLRRRRPEILGERLKAG